MEDWLLFLMEAGLDARIEDGYLWIGESRALKIDGDEVVYKTSTGQHRVGATATGVETAMRGILLAAAGHRLEARTKAKTRGLTWMNVKLASYGVALVDGEVEVGVVNPMQARILGAPEIRGNFFVDGLHWRRLVEACHEHHERMVEREERRRKAAAKTYVRGVPTTTPIRLLAPPDGLSRSLASECLAASKNIRLDRSLALGHRAQLRSRSCVLVLDPIRRLSGRLCVPFTYEEADEQVEGILTIEGSTDPVHVALYQEALNTVGVNAWVACLLGFRAVSVPELRITESEPREPRSRQPRIEKAEPSPRLRSTPTARLDSPPHWSSEVVLQRGGHNAPHWVVGHKRILPDGWEPSPAKVAQAASYGIRLAYGETWVSPHARGASPDSVMRFSWTTPPAFQARLASKTAN